MTLPRWHWLNDGLIPLLVILLRVCWLWPWLEMVRHWLAPSSSRPLLPVWTLLALFVLSAAVTRLALQKTGTLAQARAWVGGVGLLALMGLLWWQVASAEYPLWDLRWVRLLAHSLSNWQFEVPPSFLILLAAAGVWVRGVLDGQRPLLRDAVWGAFITGTLALALLLIAGHYDPAGLPPHAERWVLGFFIAGLSALALSSLQLARAVGRWGSQKGAQVRLNRYWLLSVAIVILGMVGIGLFLGMFITPGLVAEVLSWVGVVMRLVGIVLGYVLLAVAYVVFWVLTPLIEWLRSLMSGEPPPQEEEANQMDWQRQLEELSRQPQTQLSPEVIESLRWLWFVLLILGVCAAIVIALRLMNFGDSEDEDESRESIFTTDMLQDQLAALWQGWLQRLRRPPHPEQDPYLSLAGETENRRAIRGFYQSLLALAGARGHTRRPAQTPLNYGADLKATYPPDEDAWQTLTEAYMDARYAAQPPSDQQVEDARDAWARLSSRLAADPSRPDQARAAPDRQNGLELDDEDQTDSPRPRGRRGQDTP